MPIDWSECVRRVRDEGLDAGAGADLLLAAMTDRELLGLLDGDVPARRLLAIPRLIRTAPVVAAAVPRLGFPGFAFADGPRGVVVGRSTCFPVAMARAATWDVDLEREVGTAIGLETRAQGGDYSPAVCVNLLRHPAWGRAQECFGEDPVLTARMGVALTRGLRPHVMACVKHYALNSMEDMRFEVDVQVSEHDLHEVYLPHFKAVVEAGADSVMSAYNAVNGQYVDVNRHLLTDVLRDEWGFAGFVTSDWVFGTHDAIRSLEAGLDVEMPLRLRRARVLPRAAREGRLPKALVLRSARRIVATCLAFAAARPDAVPPRSIVAGPEHRALARRVAARSMVLLRNEPVDGATVLPLDPGVRRIAVLGRLATAANLGDHGSSRVRPPSTSSPLDGIREALPDVEIVHAASGMEAVAAAAAADVAVVVVGMDHDDEGEAVVTTGVDVGVLGSASTLRPVHWLLTGLAQVATRFVRGGDRRSLRLKPADERLVREVAAANARTLVVLIGGSAIVCPWRDRVPALLHAWYPGMEGGRALADVLTGAAEPAGRLPFAVPEDARDLQPFHRHARHVVYDRWWGQRILDRDGRAAAFPFGSGLGWSTCEYEVRSHDGRTARVRVRNPGTRATSAAAQVYAADVSVPRPIPQLLGFARVDVAPGQEVEIDVPLDLGPTLTRDPATRTWSPRPGNWRLSASPRSAPDWAQAVPLGARR